MYGAMVMPPVNGVDTPLGFIMIRSYGLLF